MSRIKIFIAKIRIDPRRALFIFGEWIEGAIKRLIPLIRRVRIWLPRLTIILAVIAFLSDLFGILDFFGINFISLVPGSPTQTPSIVETTLLPPMPTNPSQGRCGGEVAIFSIPQGPEGFNRRFGFVLYNSQNSPLSVNDVRALYLDGEDIWIGFAGLGNSLGLLSHTLRDAPIQPNERSWEICSSLEDGLIGPVINSIAKDQEGNLWVATDSQGSVIGSGVWKLSERNWRQYVRNQYTDDPGLPDEETYTVLPYGDNIFVGTISGFVQYDQSYWISHRDAVKGYPVVAMTIGSDSLIWAGTLRNGVFRIRPGQRSQNIRIQEGLSSDNVRSIYIDDSGRVWIATWGGGISVLSEDDNEWTYYNTSLKSLPSDFVNFVTADPLGRIWAGTEGGAAFYDRERNKWNIYSDFNTFKIVFGTKIREGCPPDAVDLWTGTSQGLTHSRLPAGSDGITDVRVAGIPARIAPGQAFTPSVTVTLEQGYILRESDFLQALDDRIFPSNPKLAVGKTVRQGESYTFSFEVDPFISPTEPGEYQTTWRVWQCTGYIGPEIHIDFTVEATPLSSPSP